MHSRFFAGSNQKTLHLSCDNFNDVLDDDESRRRPRIGSATNRSSRGNPRSHLQKAAANCNRNECNENHEDGLIRKESSCDSAKACGSSNSINDENGDMSGTEAADDEHFDIMTSYENRSSRKTNLQEKEMRGRKNQLITHHSSNGVNQLSNREEHKSMNIKQRSYACSICNKTFTQSYHLKNHKRIHSGERQFACSICNKSFTRSSHLKNHKRIHSGERPFVCGICNKSFTQSSHLIYHKKRFHAGERP